MQANQRKRSRFSDKPLSIENQMDNIHSQDSFVEEVKIHEEGDNSIEQDTNILPPRILSLSLEEKKRCLAIAEEKLRNLKKATLNCYHDDSNSINALSRALTANPIPVIASSVRSQSTDFKSKKIRLTNLRTLATKSIDSHLDEKDFEFRGKEMVAGNMISSSDKTNEGTSLVKLNIPNHLLYNASRITFLGPNGIPIVPLYPYTKENKTNTAMNKSDVNIIGLSVLNSNKIDLKKSNKAEINALSSLSFNKSIAGNYLARSSSQNLKSCRDFKKDYCKNSFTNTFQNNSKIVGNIKKTQKRPLLTTPEHHLETSYSNFSIKNINDKIKKKVLLQTPTNFNNKNPILIENIDKKETCNLTRNGISKDSKTTKNKLVEEILNENINSYLNTAIISALDKDYRISNKKSSNLITNIMPNKDLKIVNSCIGSKEIKQTSELYSGAEDEKRDKDYRNDHDYRIDKDYRVNSNLNKDDLNQNKNSYFNTNTDTDYRLNKDVSCITLNNDISCIDFRNVITSKITDADYRTTSTDQSDDDLKRMKSVVDLSKTFLNLKNKIIKKIASANLDNDCENKNIEIDKSNSDVSLSKKSIPSTKVDLKQNGLRLKKKKVPTATLR